MIGTNKMFGRTFAWKEGLDFGNALGFRSATILVQGIIFPRVTYRLRHGPGPVHTLRSAIGAGPSKQATEKARENTSMAEDEKSHRKR